MRAQGEGREGGGAHLIFHVHYIRSLPIDKQWGASFCFMEYTVMVRYILLWANIAKVKMAFLESWKL